jgi:hypothetical protein
MYENGNEQMRLLIRFGLAGVALAVPLAEVAAQEVRAGITRSWTTHALLDDPQGWGLGVGLSIRDRVAVGLGYNWSGSDFESVGSTCTGLVHPDEDCGDERRAEQARMQTATLSVPFAMYERNRIKIDLIPNMNVATVSNVRTGLRTGRTLHAEKTMVGYGIGGEVRVRVVEALPVYVRILGSMAWLSPWRSEVIADGYTPFNTGGRVSTLEVGLAVTR